jgi:hypothetical protein
MGEVKPIGDQVKEHQGSLWEILPQEICLWNNPPNRVMCQHSLLAGISDVVRPV